MALTPEQIDSAYRVVWTTVPHRERLSAFARAIESEVRKQDTELIRQLVEALENHQGNYKLTDAQCVPVNAAVTAAHARKD